MPPGGLFGHSLLDQTDDDHQNGAANAAASHIANDAAEIEAARLDASPRRNRDIDAREPFPFVAVCFLHDRP
jgi:hypothetical protein